MALALEGVRRKGLSLHGLGVVCGLTAGVWLGAAEAPTKLVNAGFSPFAISLCMVAGVFTARWTFPTLLKGTGYVFEDLSERKHLIVWALLAGALWAVANTLTVFAIRDVGLAVAFPMWNANSLIGLFWGRVLFRELEGASGRNTTKVVLGAIAIVIAAVMLGFSTIHGGAVGSHALRGIVAALGASLMWGTMYVPYRKAYLSGMNPLSFVTVFTVGELGTVLALTLALDGGVHSSAFQLFHMPGVLFWLFLGGFVWVVGDLFQQFAAKYLGIGRGIPLSNTNQLWGLAWGALVFGELAKVDRHTRWMVIGGSVLMILGALAISTAVASAKEQSSTNEAVLRECNRYGLDYQRTMMAQAGDEFGGRGGRRRWWDYLIVLTATAVFVTLGVRAMVPPLRMNLGWVVILSAVLLVSLLVGGLSLWRRTRFS
ncbi:GRP family sugar transporter [Tunturibacter empetritectus]|uniref:Drug/metabolite transporter (DMT)-like permease n=1 Tax=Tunturiibacter lichenicola TaxID=2051959 RepID=A0A7W8N4R3_9BACT|nr:GRP family sugar transporter [Edaphobacter lichenicola]MBB5345484.1 drug/metabolite transporter (DMT)-like permease [Edaphobacter lichenicola]